MNGIIGLGQFCEIHGPCLVFCTQTVYETSTENIDEYELDDVNTDKSQPNSSSSVQTCEGCTSLGLGKALISKEEDSSQISYISTQFPRKKQLRQYLKQACVRSLSCEVGGSTKSDEGGTMCYCDEERGGYTVLCHTWKVPDAQSRGFHRWLTIVLLMKDRFMLLTSWPFFIKHVQELVKYLQDEAQKVYTIEESKGNNRAARIQLGRAPTCAPRSLAHLCDLPTVWAILHTRFSWILHSAPKTIQEVPSHRNLVVDSKTSQCIDTNVDSSTYTFQNVYKKLSVENFTSLCHCLTTGIQVVIRGDEDEGVSIAQLLSSLLPSGKACICTSSKYLSPEECSLLTVGMNVALPKSSENIYRIDILPDKWIVKWEGSLPEKCNTLVTQIVKAVKDSRLNAATIRAHIKGLIIHWLNVAKAVQMAGANGINNKLFLRTLGVTSEDLQMVNCWVQSLNNS